MHGRGGNLMSKNGLEKAIVTEWFGQALADEMARIEAICESVGFVCKPTLILRHPDGASRSVVIGNDDPQKLVKCVTDLHAVDSGSTMRVVETERLVVE